MISEEDHGGGNYSSPDEKQSSRLGQEGFLWSGSESNHCWMCKHFIF